MNFSSLISDLFTQLSRPEELSFANGSPDTLDLMCAELSRLAYTKFEDGGAPLKTVEEALKRAGFDKWKFFAADETQGMLVENRKRHISVLAFRGTEIQAMQDVLTDTNLLMGSWLGDGKVHAGFARALAAVWNEVSAAAENAWGSLLITGHSLGAALATLAATQLDTAALYTFGSPRVGDFDFIASLGEVPIRRYVHCCDIVTRIPPEAFGYTHAGARRYIDRHTIVQPKFDDLQVEQDQAAARDDAGIVIQWQNQSVSLCDVQHHSSDHYVSALKVTPSRISRAA